MRLRPAALPLLAALALLAATTVAPAPAAVRPAPAAPRAMVALPEPTAARAALDVLRAGGNAVDAAVAAGFALAVTHPSAGNLGGGGFMLIRLADGSAHFVDYRERAPAAGHREMFVGGDGRVDETLSRESYLAIGVPGTVAGLALARDRFGTMPLARLLAPAISIAETGFEVPEDLAEAIRRSQALLARHPASAAIFLPGGAPPRPGSLLVQKDLARALREIARDGPRAFYAGAIAEGIVSSMAKNGGLVSREDLAGYRALLRDPIRTRYRGYEVVTAAPPSAGGIILAEMLHMLEPHDLRVLGHGSSAYIHLLAEVMKRAYADRATFLGDPDHVRIPVRGLLSPAYAQRLMAGYDPASATPARAAGPGEPARYESDSTTHFTIADEHGNVVANTYTLNGSFGMGAVVEGWGFLLNNEMDDFSARPGEPNMYGLVGGEANAIAPGKRMLSSMTPTILLREGHPFLALGTPGGGRITTMVLQVILNVVDFEMEIQAAVNAPRCHHQWLPDVLHCEADALTTDVRSNLLKRGHAVESGRARGDVQAILFDPAAGRLRGAADARGYGVALGY